MILPASFGSWLSLASTVFAAVAAVATIVAVMYARQTVNASQVATKTIGEQHREQIAELKAAGAASHTASKRELLERRIMFDHDLAVQRLRQLQRIADTLSEVIHAAREERTSSSERIVDIQPGRGLSSTRIPALQRQLRIEVRILKQLRGPDVNEVIPSEERDDQQAGLERLWFDGLAALEGIGGLIETYEAFQPDAAWDRVQESVATRPGDMLGGA